MINTIRELLLKVVSNIDSGNSNLTELEEFEIIDKIRLLTDKELRLSKYLAHRYLNVSRATFDNYIRSGRLPKGTHTAGFKELSWSKKDLDKFIRDYKYDNTKERK